MKKILIPGSFDPITLGHMDIMNRTRTMCDILYCCILINDNKNYMFSLQQRLEMLKTALQDIPGVVTDSYDGMLVDYLRREGITTVVKGVRNTSDFEYEKSMAQFNREKYPSCETLLMFSSDKYADISSTRARDCILKHTSLEGILHPNVIKYINKLN